MRALAKPMYSSVVETGELQKGQIDHILWRWDRVPPKTQYMPKGFEHAIQILLKTTIYIAPVCFDVVADQEIGYFNTVELPSICFGEDIELNPFAMKGKVFLIRWKAFKAQDLPFILNLYSTKAITSVELRRGS
jgi:hypothetical protein